MFLYSIIVIDVHGAFFASVVFCLVSSRDACDDHNHDLVKCSWDLFCQVCLLLGVVAGDRVLTASGGLTGVHSVTESYPSFIVCLSKRRGEKSSIRRE